MEGFLRYDAYQLLTTLAYWISRFFFSSGIYKYIGFLSFFISLAPPENIYRFPKKYRSFFILMWNNFWQLLPIAFQEFLNTPLKRTTLLYRLHIECLFVSTLWALLLKSHWLIVVRIICFTVFNNMNHTKI